MALFQPTNIIPSSFTDGVVDAVKDVAQISWQVNGNSKMTAFEINFYENDDDSSIIRGAGTGRITVNGGFLGTDRFGKLKTYTWTANGNVTWNNYNSVFTNDKQFKFKIKQYWQEGGAEKSIEQIESSVFITRDRPNITIRRSADSKFTDLSDFPKGSDLASSIGYFVGIYTQAQGAPVMDVRWQIATWVNGDAGEILSDTGPVDTPTLEFVFNGFFIGNEYAVRCSGKADYQTYGSQDFDSGWWNFTAKIPDDQKQSEYNGNFVVRCVPKENAVLLEWAAVGVIPAATSPEEFNPTTENGSVVLPAKKGDIEYSIAWKEQTTDESGEIVKNPLAFASPWAAAIRFKPSTTTLQLSPQNVTGRASETTTHPEYAGNPSHASSGGGVKPDSPSAVVAGYYLTKFTIRPYGNYAEVDLYTPTQITLYPISTGQRLVRATAEDNGDGSITVTTSSTMAVTSADIYVRYTSYSYSEKVPCPLDIVSVDAVVLGQNTLSYNASIDGKILTVVLYGKYSGGSLYYPPVSADVTVTCRRFYPQEKLFELGGNNIRIGVKEGGLSFFNGNSNLGSVEVPTTTPSVVAIVTPTSFTGIGYKKGDAVVQSRSVSYGAQLPVTYVTVYGGDRGVTVESVSVYRGASVPQLYEDPDFEPIWNNSGYSLYMTANFNGNLEGGTGTASGDGFRIYRQEVGSDVRTPIATLPSTETSLKDYGIRSRRAYTYSLYAYDINGAFMKSVENETVVSTNFKCFSLLICDYDSENDAYHVRKQYLFALNLSGGSVGNNNTPTISKNFTSYPTRMPDTANYASGTLQGLIGAVYTVPALIEQIGGFKHTKKPSTLDYFDSVDLEKELYDLSVAPYQLFLRDMEGHLRMISTSNPIGMTPDLKKRQIPKTISFPWVEIGDASDVTIIQTPDDYGWNSDNDVLDVRLDVDPLTGILTANYPKPYEGTKFYLTGTNRETLGAKTPIGVTPAKFGLSDSASEPSDGILTATVKVNKEEN